MNQPTDEQRARIERIYERDGALPDGVDPYDFALEILPFLGSTDGPFREQRILGLLYALIIRRELTDGQICHLAKAMADEEHLFLDIGNVEGDAVYMRTFCVFMLSVVVKAHRQRPFLTADDLQHLKRVTIEYLEQEQDLRGYVSDQTWWAHGVAHAADVVGELCQCTELVREDLRELLAAGARAVTPDVLVFAHEEDTRMAQAALHALARDELSADDVASWLSSIIPETRWTGRLPSDHFRYVNARNLLRALYHEGRTAKLDTDRLVSILAAHDRLPDR